MKILFCGLLLLLFSFKSSFSQDKIILTDGRKLKCEIISEDSISVEVNLRSKGIYKNTTIQKKYIQAIFYGEQYYTRDIVTCLNGDIIECRILKEDSVGLTALVHKGGIENKLYLIKKNIKAVSYGKMQHDNTLKTSQKNMINRIALCLGPSIATGKFGNSDAYDVEAGLARTGGNLSLIYLTSKITPNFGIGIKGYGNANELDNVAINDQLTKISGSTWDSNNSYWYSYGLLGGFVCFLPASDVTFELRALVGLMALSTPDPKFTESNSNRWIQLDKSTEYTFGFNPGIGFDILISRSCSFLLNLDYLYGKFKFNDSKATYSRGIGSTNIFGKGSTQVFSVVNLTFGIGYYFGD